ncbi:unnamed protein product [Protopolystoma xenopodis]|uniref:Uncharacterized protein n=1 Tax=Protopolystoma xenopodis TaxID=117903 RepID=A0A448WJQ7_9PLAT|nr:unnamed protein product [Protopolystoma xenopodis]
MAKLTDDADNDACQRLRMYQVHCLMLGIMKTTKADDFGLVQVNWQHRQTEKEGIGGRVGLDVPVKRSGSILPSSSDSIGLWISPSLMLGNSSVFSQTSLIAYNTARTIGSQN